MADILGFVQPNLDPDRDGATKVKLQMHRAGLNFNVEGFIVTVNKTDAQVDGTDYTALKYTANLSLAATAGDTTIKVSSIWGFARSRTITISEGATTETKTIQSIDVATKIITLNSALSNSYTTSATASMNQLTVSYSSGVTTIDYVVCGQNSNSSLAGGDIQKADVYIESGQSFSNFDLIRAKVIVPYWTGASWMDINGPWFCRNLYCVSGMNGLRVDSDESASFVDPNYILRVYVASGDTTPTPKKVCVMLGIWRG